MARGFKYGYPATADVDGVSPQVQWIFDEASGSIVDEWAGVTLVDYQNPVYGVDSSDYSPYMTRSIYLGYAAASQFYKAGVEANMALAMSISKTIEMVFKMGSVTHDGTVLECMNDAGTRGYRLDFNTLSSTIVLYLIATDGTAVTCSWANTFDTRWHKLRISTNITTGAICRMDGTMKGSPVSIATLAGKTCQANNIAFGSRWDNSHQSDIYLNEFRLSANGNANSGGPGEDGLEKTYRSFRTRSFKC